MMRDARSAQFSSRSLALFVFAAVLLARLVVLLRFSASAFLLPARGDMHFYNEWALRILHGQWTDGHAFYGLPLYPYLLALIYKLVGYTPYVPAFLQNCADSATAAILFLLGSYLVPNKVALTLGQVRLTQGNLVGMVAAAGWCLYLPAQAYSTILMPTALAVFVFWAVVAHIVRRVTMPQVWQAIAFGALIGFTAMGIATTLFLLPLFAAALFLKWNDWSKRQLKRATLLFALLLVGAGIGTMPCWAHNYFIAHDPVLLSAHSGVNFWIGNNPVANGYPKMPPGLHAGQTAMLEDSIRVPEQELGRKLQRSEVSRYWSTKADNYIRQNPLAAAKLVTTKVANFWSSYQYDDLSIITNLRAQRVLLPGFRYGLIAVFALAGIPFVLRRFRLSRWVLAAVIAQMASLLTVFVTERYRLAAVPGLILLAALGVNLLFDNLKNRRWSVTLAQLASIALATFLVSSPRGDASLWALDAYNAGWQALASRNYPLAKKELELAYAYVPSNPEINFALGNLEFEQGKPAAAKPYYAATLQLDPEHVGAWKNLGVIALDETRWELAARFLTVALSVHPKDAKAHFLLARADLELGRYSEAREHIDSALETSPNEKELLELRQTVDARAL